MKILKSVIIIFWLISFGWLFRYHIAPSLFTDTIAGYESIIGSDTLVKDEWLILSYRGQPFGYLHYKLDTEQQSAGEYYQVSNTARLKLRSTARSQPVHATIRSDISLNISRRLQAFELQFSTMRDGTLIKLTGARKENEQYAVSMTGDDQDREFEINIPEDAIFSFPLGGYSFNHLEPGDRVTVQILEPLTWERENLLFEVSRRENAVVDDNSVQLTVVECNYRGIGIEFHITEDGRLIRQQTSTGLVAERASAEEAAETFRRAEGLDTGFIDPAQVVRFLQDIYAE